MLALDAPSTGAVLLGLRPDRCQDLMPYKRLDTISEEEAAEQRSKQRLQKRRWRAKQKGEVYPKPIVPLKDLPPLPVIVARPPRSAAYSRYMDEMRRIRDLRRGADPYWERPRDPEWESPYVAFADRRERPEPTPEEIEAFERTTWHQFDQSEREQSPRLSDVPRRKQKHEPHQSAARS